MRVMFDNIPICGLGLWNKHRANPNAELVACGERGDLRYGVRLARGTTPAKYLLRIVGANRLLGA